MITVNYSKLYLWITELTKYVYWLVVLEFVITALFVLLLFITRTTFRDVFLQSYYLFGLLSFYLLLYIILPLFILTTSFKWYLKRKGLNHPYGVSMVSILYLGIVAMGLNFCFGMILFYLISMD